MKAHHLKRLAAEPADDVMSRNAPTLLSSGEGDGAAPRLKPHGVRVKDGMLVVDETPHLMDCALVRVVLKGPHYMLSRGEAQPLVGGAMRCDCGSVVHDAGRRR